MNFCTGPLELISIYKKQVLFTDSLTLQQSLTIQYEYPAGGESPK